MTGEERMLLVAGGIGTFFGFLAGRWCVACAVGGKDDCSVVLVRRRERSEGLMEPGELTRRRRNKALQLLRNMRLVPHLTTTEALCALSAACGAVKFHRLLAKRGLAKPVTGLDGGYDFALPAEYGGGTFSIAHHSFHWTPRGVWFMARVLREERIAHEMPPELTSRLGIEN